MDMVMAPEENLCPFTPVPVGYRFKAVYKKGKKESLLPKSSKLPKI